MRKQEFLAALRKGLDGLPQEDIEERLCFYGEMIDDRMDDGLSEQEAVAAIGSVEEITAQILAETPLLKLAKERLAKKRQMKAWDIVLLVLGAPIWLSLLIAVFAVVLAVYTSLWSVIISLWAVFGSLIACALAGVLSGVFFLCEGHAASGFLMLSASLMCAGLSILFFFGCKAATDGLVWLTKKSVLRTKKIFVKKEEPSCP